ncbi:MAG: hypothetical protein LBU88_04105 [Treponema sp.]|jgi:hypothetical protein|nr:hypothetical protein [Treponema sp.]
MKKNFLIFIFILILLPLTAGAADFGIVLNQNITAANFTGENNVFEYRAELLPRFSALIDDIRSFNITAGLSFEVRDSAFTFIPQILNAEYLTRFDILDGIWLKAGRMSYIDPLGFIAEGVYDGVHAAHASSLGRFGFGLWYTGLLYKKNINIEMSDRDRGHNDLSLNYNDFFNTYFASKRFLAAIDYEHPFLLETITIKASIMAQFDLNGESESINSQYLSLKAGLPVGKFLFEAGGILQLAQIENPPNNANTIAFAGDLGVFWFPSENSLLSFKWQIAGGQTSETMGAFIPVVSKHQGRLFQPILSALTVLKLNYTVRLSEAMGINAYISYFIRNDKASYNNFNITVGETGYFLGPEIYARFVYNPFSDLQFNLGAGIFAPVLGDVAPNDNLQWRVDLSVIFSIY